jgi:hypothetical protein
MIFRATLYVVIHTLSLSSIANFDANHFLIKSVQQHPDVIEKLNTISLEGIQIGQLIAEDGLQINFFTESKLPLPFLNGIHFKGDIADKEDTYIKGV